MSHYRPCDDTLENSEYMNKYMLKSWLPYSDQFICSMPNLSELLFVIIEQYIDGNSLLLQRYVRKGIDSKNPAIFSFKALSSGLCSFKALSDLHVPEVRNRYRFQNRKIKI